MTNEEYLSAIDEVIYLSGCVVNGITPDKERIEKTDLNYLYEAADKHMLTAIVGYALASVGISDRKFSQALAKSIRKVTMMDIERAEIIKEMEKEGIWYMPLKGIVLKKLYPSVGLRQLSDNDILFDEKYAEKVKQIMLELGFSVKNYGKFNHDVYFKIPVSNFEMHKTLFCAYDSQTIYDYYLNVKDFLQKDDDNCFGYHFRNEDLYIYVTAHEFKHFEYGGTGLRSVLDTYVMLDKFGDSLDMDYILSETEKLGIADFEMQNRSLAIHLFGAGELTDEDKKMLEFVICSGTYGTLENKFTKQIESSGSVRKGKLYLLWNAVFPTMKKLETYYPFFYKHKILIPFFPFYRVFCGLTKDRKTTKQKFKALKKI